MKNFDEFNTFLVQNIGSKTRAIAPTITSSAAFGYEDAEGIFAGSVQNPLYARMGNPNLKLPDYRDFTVEQCQFLGICDGLIRISVGLESPHTIAEDFIQASR